MFTAVLISSISVVVAVSVSSIFLLKYAKKNPSSNDK